MTPIRRLISFLRSASLQQYINAIIVGIGLTADIISLALFFGAINTSPSGSNFYVNGREFLSWVLIAIVYSIGLINATIRRRWHRIYGDVRANHSVFNLFAKYSTYDSETNALRVRNFQRDFSFLYVVMFIVTFLFSRAVTATDTSTGITPSPWGDLVATVFIAIPFTLAMMVITSMFDFALSMFSGDGSTL